MNAFRLGRPVTFLSAVLALGLSAPLFAQNRQAAQGAQAAQGQRPLEEITVTGTRILRRDFTSASPIVTVNSNSFNQRTNIGLEATLDQLPQFSTVGAGTQAATSAAGTPFPQAGAAPGAATVNLRGLGLNRNLVLLDGRRVQPVNGLLVVDLNTIPAAAIQRVEVITGGAAAVYGADAIAGVVNFITKKDFRGLQFNVQSGMSQEHDGQQTTLSGLFGAGNDRGDVMLGANFSKRGIILGKNRAWVRRGWADPGTNGGSIGSSNLSQYDPNHASYCSVTNCGQPFFPPNTPTAGFPLVGSTYVIDQNGNIFDSSDPLNSAHPYTGPLGGNSGFKINPNGALGYNDHEHNYLQLPLKRYSLFGSGHLKLTDKISAFSQINFAETYVTAQGFVSSLFNIWSPTIPYNPAYDDPNSPTFGQLPPPVFGQPPPTLHPVPAQLATLLNSRPVPNAPWTYAGGMDYLPNFKTETTTNVYQVTGGLDSDFTVNGKPWTWEFYASHGNTDVNARQPEGFPSLARMQNLFNANEYGTNFDISSLPGYVPLAVTGHCTSGLPIFNPDGSVNNTPSVSQDCADYAVLRMNSITELQQDVVEGNVQGGIATMPAGTLSFSFGSDYRRDHFAFNPDSGYNANQAFPNVVQNIILPVAVDGTTTVKEAYGELAIPLVKGKKLVQSFEIDPGIRYSDYDTVGRVKTYKVLGDWTVNKWIRFRGGHQYANRAPNVTELFTPVGGSALEGGTDACSNYPGLTQPWGNVAGNPNRYNVQVLCQYLMTRDGAPASLYVPGTASANNYAYNVFGTQGLPGYFPFDIGVTQGNPDLGSETANTYTWGVVLTPIDQLTFAIDWYRIKLKNAIGVPMHDAVYQQCLDANYNSLVGDSAGSHTGAELAAGNPFCALIEREYVGGAPLTPGNYGADRKYNAEYINQGGIESEGVDLQANWSKQLRGSGTFNMNVQASFLSTYSQSPFPGAPFVDYTGTTTNSSFDYQLLSNFRYGKGPLSIGVRWQHLPSLNPAPGSGAGSLPVHSHDQVDMYGSWRFGDRYELRGGVDNVANADPEWVGATIINNAIGSTNANYDQVGRQYYVGLSISM